MRSASFVEWWVSISPLVILRVPDAVFVACVGTGKRNSCFFDDQDQAVSWDKEHAQAQDARAIRHGLEDPSSSERVVRSSSLGFEYYAMLPILPNQICPTPSVTGPAVAALLFAFVLDVTLYHILLSPFYPTAPYVIDNCSYI